MPKARVLAASVKKHCKNARFSLVLADAWPVDLQQDREPFDEIILVEELGIPVSNLSLWIFEHTVVELCTAIKGQALVNFLEKGSDKVVYLDPDIVVYDDLTDLERLLDENDIVLTPHQTLPETNKNDIIHNEICSLQHGTYNFGFYAVRNSDNGLKFARWWRDRLVDFCFDDIPNGIFTDQKWGDLVPAMFDGVCILRNPGYNVSTWNLSNRKVMKDSAGKIFVNNCPLQFYHFSGFDSGAQERMLNMYADGNPVLFEMREWYIKEQNKAGQQKYGQTPSIYNFYDNGEKIDKKERGLIRSREDLQRHFKAINPYVTVQERSFYDWYRKEGQKQGENSELEAIYSSRSWKVAQCLSKIYGKITGR